VDVFVSADIFGLYGIDMMKPLDGTVAGRKEKASHPSFVLSITRARRDHSCIGCVGVMC
jgi:hypothetical protein